MINIDYKKVKRVQQAAVLLYEADKDEIDYDESQIDELIKKPYLF